MQLIGEPPPTVTHSALEDWLVDHVVTGDGHPCGSREHALYEVEVVAADDRPDLIGTSGAWEG